MKEKLNKGIKVRIFPNEEQVGQIRLSFMWARNFYNYLVEYQKDYTKAIWIMRDREGGYIKDKNGKVLLFDKKGNESEKGKPQFIYKGNVYLSKFDLMKLASPYRKLHKDAGASKVDSNMYGMVASSFYQAIQNQYNPKMINAKAPKKHKWITSYTSRYTKASRFSSTKKSGSVPSMYSVTKHWVNVPKLGMVKYSGSQSLKNIKPKNFTITEDKTGKFYMSIIIEYHKGIKPVKPVKVVGIDLGLDTLAITSEGKKYKIIPFTKNHERTLTIKSRKADKRRLLMKTVVNSPKNKAKLFPLTQNDFPSVDKAYKERALVYKHTANQRNNYLHEVSRSIVDSADAVIVEDITASFMMKGGKSKKTGRKTKNTSAKSASNASWNKLLVYLEYKCKEDGKQFIKVNKNYTSQICHDCGYLYKNLGVPNGGDNRHVREWDCPKCGKHHDRDINAAINIKNRGLEVIE